MKPTLSNELGVSAKLTETQQGELTNDEDKQPSHQSEMKQDGPSLEKVDLAQSQPILTVKEQLPETGEASMAWFTLASTAVLTGVGLSLVKRPEEE